MSVRQNLPAPAISASLEAESVSQHGKLDKNTAEAGVSWPAPSKQSRNGKKVSFAEQESDEEDSLPVIQSSSNIASSRADPTVSPTPRSAVASGPVKPMIIEKDITKPPPALTAAERSARKSTSFSVAESFDGVASSSTKVDLSAYLPKSLRAAGTATSGRGKAVAVQEEESQMAEYQDNHEAEDEEYDETSEEDLDGLYDYGYSDEEDDEENIHIDDVLAMREAALEYHAKRYNLGAGAGTGPLGGHGRPDEFEEVRLHRSRSASHLPMCLAILYSRA